MIFQKIKVGTSVIPHFRVILTGKSISYIIFMIQGHPQGQRSNRKLNKRGYDFYEIMLGTCIIPHFVEF